MTGRLKRAYEKAKEVLRNCATYSEDEKKEAIEYVDDRIGNYEDGVVHIFGLLDLSAYNLLDCYVDAVKNEEKHSADKRSGYYDAISHLIKYTFYYACKD